MEAGSDSSSDDGAIDLEPEIVTEIRGVTLYLNDSVGANRYRGVYKQGPNRWLAKMWSSRAKKHVMIGEYATQEDAAYAYAMAKNGDRPVPASSSTSTVDVAIELFKGIKRQREDGKITHEEGAELQKELLMAVSL